MYILLLNIKYFKFILYSGLKNIHDLSLIANENIHECLTWGDTVNTQNFTLL